jgi:tellurium resistance protein TerD
MGDNRTGDGDGDDEVININLSQVDGQIIQMIFAVTIDKATEKGQHFGMIDNAFIRIQNKDTGEELCRYSLNSQYSGSDSVQVGRVYRYDGSWHFEAMGDGYSGGLGSLVNIYK